tara:strand:+ start:3597 stop:5642 length:2046 start_codon:yes stop_codon:yes gene_type:complete
MGLQNLNSAFDDIVSKLSDSKLETTAKAPIPVNREKLTTLWEQSALETDEYKPVQLGRGDYTFSTLFTNDQKVKVDRPTGMLPGNSRLNLNPGGFKLLHQSGFRGDEPYVISRINENRFLYKTKYSSRFLPLGRATQDVERLGKFVLSAAGITWMVKENILSRFNTYSPKLYNPLSLGSAIPLVAGVKFRMSRGFLVDEGKYPFHYVMENPKTLFNADELTNPGMVGFVTAGNMAAGYNTMGGNLYQAAGLNVLGGPPDFTNVGIAPHDNPITYFLGAGVSNLERTYRSSEWTRTFYDKKAEGTKILGGDVEITGRSADLVLGQYSVLGATNYIQFRNLIESLPAAGEVPTSADVMKRPSAKKLQAPLATLGALGKNNALIKKLDEFASKGTTDAEHDKVNNNIELTNEDETLDNKLKPFLKYSERPESDTGKNVDKNYTKNKVPSDYYPHQLDPRVQKTPLKSLPGDLMTVMPVKPGGTINEAYSEESITSEMLEEEKNGYLLYFKDLRDNSYLFFRGYVEGLTETVTPNWPGTAYVGRSDQVFSYENTERTVDFTLQLFAQTSSELDAIYDKINKLTSFCYPQFKKDSVNFDTKLRSKPPLLKFRFADLYGKKDNEILGFIKSLTYAFPETSPWEIESGKRVPKHVTATISYQVIHNEIPNMTTQFYGKEITNNIHHID